MSSSEQSIQRDAEQMQQWLAGDFDTTSVASFKPGPGIAKLDLKFDIDELRKCYFELQKHVENLGSGFHALALTRRPGVEVPEPYDLVGRFWTRTDDTYQEYARDEMVDESLFTEFNPLFKDTYFEEVHKQLIARFPIGRMRVLKKTSITATPGTVIRSHGCTFRLSATPVHCLSSTITVPTCRRTVRSISPIPAATTPP
ncbi:hypothetical protein [Aliamphritea spongicola]|nr:hypothetical protein [Aliamphritea spongicola]